MNRLPLQFPATTRSFTPTTSSRMAAAPSCSICKTGADFDSVPPPEPRTGTPRRRSRSRGYCGKPASLPGLLVSPDAIRLVYAPKGESSGHITFKIADMAQVAGRPILAALHMLLSAERLFTARSRSAPARTACRQPQAPERRLQQALRTSHGGAVRSAARLPVGARSNRRSRRSATRRPEPGLCRSAHGLASSRLHSVRRGPRPALVGRDLRQQLLRGRAV